MLIPKYVFSLVKKCLPIPILFGIKMSKNTKWVYTEMNLTSVSMVHFLAKIPIRCVKA